MFRFFKRLFIARPGTAEARNLPVRDPAQLLNDELLLDSLAQKEASNDLKFITPARCAELFHDWRAGKMGDVQRIFDQLEQFDDSLFACVRARQGALEAMPWSVIVDADAVGEDARLRRLAESQKQLLLARLGAVENLEEAVTHLGLADFRGVAALCIQGNERRMRWTVIEPWLLARPSRALPWRYNPTAETSHSNLQALRAERLILREASPIDLPALFLIVSKYHAQTSWDSFLDFFGNPSIFLEMPGATDQAQAARFDAIVKKLVAEGRGTIPQGANFHTVETQRDNSQAFADRARRCSDAILTLGTGGKLTVTTEANSGTLAGNAHQESFERLCAASSRSISECINRQFCRRILREAFPDQPQLALFELAAQQEDDLTEQAQIIATLSSAGFRPSAETVSEMMGFEVQTVSPHPSVSSPALPPVSNSSASDSEPLSPIRNSKLVTRNSEASPGEPLTPSEIAALQDLSKGFAPDQLEADADSIYTSLAEAISAPAEQDEEEQEEQPVENSECRSPNGPQGCSNPEHNLRASQKGSRATKGNPRAKTTQSNTPLKAAPAAKPQAKVDAIDHALKSTQKGGKNVMGAATIDKKPLDILGGHPSTEGSSHAARHFGPGETDRRSLAKSIVLGYKQPDKTETASVRKDYKAILATHGKGKKARTKIITTRPKLDSD